MNSQGTESFLVKALAFGAFLTTVLVFTGVSDPVNVPKMVVLVTLAFGLFGVLLFSKALRVLIENKILSAATLMFVVFAVFAVTQSASPFNQNFYGTFGRNTGLLTYLSLALLLLIAATIRNINSFRFLLWSLLIAGFVNVLYCLWVVIFGDFIPWTNPYKNILGTLGNPNFIGAFLGIFISVYVAYLLNPGVKLIYRGVGICVLLIAVYEVKASHAVQGIVVSAGGVAIVGYFFIRSRTKREIFPSLYVLAVSAVGLVAVLGALQKGPLTSIIYKTSVSLRGEYWQAAWNMANKHPLTGVGMDSYGDWYRRARDTQAMILPGPNVVTNAAHNVPLDLLAYGGYPLFISFLALILISLISVIRIVQRNRNYDWVAVGLVTAWACYHVQSIISINQIGIAIWGWILNGAVIAYEKITRSAANQPEISKTKRENRVRTENQFISPQLIFGLSAAVGFVLAFPAFNADHQYRKALTVSQLPAIEKSLTSSYMTPTSSRSLVEAVGLIANNNLPDLAHKYALEGIKFNPDYFDAWRMLYSIPQSTNEEKIEAKKNLIRLDPLNPEWKNLP